MLEQSWEVHATTLANAPTDDDLVAEYNTLAQHLNISPDTPANVILARDTRESGPALVESLTAALEAVGTTVTDEGVLSTPQLHYLVRCINTQDFEPYGTPTEQGYYEKIGTAYKKLMENVPSTGQVTVDCANGVGAIALRKLADYIGTETLDLQIINGLVDDPSKLNFQVRYPFNSALHHT